MHLLLGPFITDQMRGSNSLIPCDTVRSVPIAMNTNEALVIEYFALCVRIGGDIAPAYSSAPEEIARPACFLNPQCTISRPGHTSMLQETHQKQGQHQLALC